MRRWAIATLVAALVVAVTLQPAFAAVPQKLLGTWRATGGATITFQKSGRAVFRISPYPAETNTFSATATRMTISPTPVCAGKGTYSWKVSGTSLTLKPVADRCSFRRRFLTGTWQRKR